MEESRKWFRTSYEEAKELGVLLGTFFSYLRKTQQYNRKNSDDGFFEFGSGKITTDLGLTKNEQYYYLKSLEDKGYILKENRNNKRFVKIIKKVGGENE